METIGRAKTRQGGVWLACYGLRELLDNLAEGMSDSDVRDNLRLARNAMTAALDKVEDAAGYLGLIPGEPE